MYLALEEDTQFKHNIVVKHNVANACRAVLKLRP